MTAVAGGAVKKGLGTVGIKGPMADRAGNVAGGSVNGAMQGFTTAGPKGAVAGAAIQGAKGLDPSIAQAVDNTVKPIQGVPFVGDAASSITG